MAVEFHLDEPWSFLNKRGNPVSGRRLTFTLSDGTVVTIDLTSAEYGNIEVTEAKLAKAISAHEAIKALVA